MDDRRDGKAVREAAMFSNVIDDVRAVRRHDPSVHGWLEVLLCHAPLHAMLLHRLSHWLHRRLGLRVLARLVSPVSRFWSGMSGVAERGQDRAGDGLDHREPVL
jgi:serine acetyltransferase